MIAVYLKLMESLKEIIVDEKERKKHILENMLYMSEINKKNVLICNQIFNINNEYKLNLYEGDSLKLDTLKVFGIQKFDIIVGNPPYNASGTKATGNTIWQLFVMLSFKLIKENGYISLIHPSGWRKPISDNGKSNKLFELMTLKNNMIYLEMHDTKDGLKTFNCGTKYDWYIINIKNSVDHKTIIIDEKKNKHMLDLKNYSFLPNSNIELFNKIYCKEPDITNIIYSRSAYGSDKKWISKIKNDEYKYNVIHSTTKAGCKYLYSNTKDKGFYGIKKIIFGDSGINEPIIDINGDLLISEHAMAIPIINNNEQQIYNAIKSEKFKDFLKSCMWSNFQIDWRLFTYLRKDFYIEFINNKVLEEVNKTKINLKNIVEEKNNNEQTIQEEIKKPKKIIKKKIKNDE